MAKISDRFEIKYVVFAACVLSMFVFGLLGNAPALYGFLILAIIILMLLNPDIFEFIKVPGGGEIKMWSQEAKNAAEEIKQLSVDIGAVALLAAHDNEGPLPDRQSQIDRFDMLVECGERMLEYAPSDTKFYKSVESFHHSETLYEYQLYVQRAIHSIVSRAEYKREDFHAEPEDVFRRLRGKDEDWVPAKAFRELSEKLHIHDHEIVTLIDD